MLPTHDAAASALPTVSGMLARYDPYTLQSARQVQAVARATKPKLLFHGHWHQFQQIPLAGQETEVIGLSYHGTSRSSMAKNLPGLEITHERTGGAESR